MSTNKLILIVIFCISSASFSYSQEMSKSAVHYDAFGAGWYANIKFIRALRYEYFLVSKEKHALILQGGIGVSKWTDFRSDFNPDILLPFSVAYMYGKGRSHPIISAGMIYSNYTFFNSTEIQIDRHQQISPYWSAGYRYTHTNGFTASIFYTGTLDAFCVIRYGGGISLGYRFKKSKQ